MNIQEPIVIIGAGRSGSTLLTRILNAHPEIDFKGESDFLLPRLWLEAWENRFWLNWERKASINPTSARTPLPELSESQLQLERARVGKLVAEFLAQIFRVDMRRSRVWGYKEPWNGSSSFHYGWEPYDAVLPRAHWVHLVRHPFAFARSAAQWDDAPWTFPYLRARLNDWKTMVVHNRLRANTGRFCEIRFEDLTRNLHGTLLPVFEFAGLQWHAACAEAAALRVMASQPSEGVEFPIRLAATHLEKVVEEIAGLRELMSEFNYAVPETLALQAAEDDLRPQQKTRADLRNPEGSWPEDSPPRFVLKGQMIETEQQLHRTLAKLAECQTQLAASQGQVAQAQAQLTASQTQETSSAAQLSERERELADAQGQLVASRARESDGAVQLSECREQLAGTQAQLAASQARQADCAAQLSECRSILERLPEPQRAVAERLTAFPRLTAFLARVLRASV